MRLARLVVVCLAALASAGSMHAASSETTAFVDVNVIPMTADTVEQHRTVVVRDGRIVAAGPTADVVVPPDATKIDGGGRYLVPGLADLHVHLYDRGDLTLYLANGVTTIANLGGSPSSLDLRDALRHGDLDGPRMFTCGPPIVGIEDADAARRLVNREKRDGYDCIKIYDDISHDAYLALADEARREGIRSVGHIPRNLGWKEMLEAKPSGVAHAEEFLYSPLSGEDLPRIGETMREAGISLVTTFVTYDHIGRQVADIDRELDRGEIRFVSPVDRRAWAPGRNTYLQRFSPDRVPRLRQLLGVQMTIVRRLHADGVRILLGTDAGGVPFVIPGYAAIEELSNLVAAGLTPYDAMRAATIDAARELGVAERRGTIEVGKDADLVLLMGNPLDDIRNASLQAGTMIRGRWLPREELRRRMEMLAEDRAVEGGILSALVADWDTTSRSLLAMRERGAEPGIGLRTLNELGYQAWKLDDRLDEAIRLFELNAQLHPMSWVVFDSLADAYAAAGRTDDAIANLERALALEPRDRDAEERLEELRKRSVPSPGGGPSHSNVVNPVIPRSTRQKIAAPDYSDRWPRVTRDPLREPDLLTRQGIPRWRSG